MMPSLTLRTIIDEVKRSQREAEYEIDKAFDKPDLTNYHAGKLTAYTFTLALLNLALIDIIAYENTHNIVLFPEDKS